MYILLIVEHKLITTQNMIAPLVILVQSTTDGTRDFQ